MPSLTLCSTFPLVTTIGSKGQLLAVGCILDLFNVQVVGGRRYIRFEGRGFIRFVCLPLPLGVHGGGAVLDLPQMWGCDFPWPLYRVDKKVN